MQQVNTRGGVFTPEGYGGGVFNGNVAFGAVEAIPSRVGPFLGGLGAWGAVPWYCWGGGDPDLPVNQAFRDCAGTVQSRSEFSGRPLSDPQLVAAIEQTCGGLCNMEEAAETVYGSGGYSAQTAEMQSRVNSHIHANRANNPDYPYCPIDVDGKIGPETCTAVRTLFPGNVPPQCSDFGSSDWANRDCGGGKTVPPTPELPVAPSPTVVDEEVVINKPTRGASTATMVVGGVIAAAAIGGLAWYGSEAGWFG